RLAEAMGGAVTLRSRVGRGSTFRLEIAAPATEATQVEGGVTALGDLLDGLRVLVADDNETNRDLARAILAPAGIEVSDASDGDVAVEMARAMPYDAILMDLRMPGLGGLEALARIRGVAGPNQ